MATIINDDDLPTIIMDDFSVLEGDLGTTNAIFTATLNHPSSTPITVDYFTQSGSAVENDDFQATSGTLTITPLTTSSSSNVVVNSDLENEDNETFQLFMQNHSLNSIRIDSGGTGTILNDDGIPQISIEDRSIIEGQTGTPLHMVNLNLSNPTSQTISVSYNFISGSAIIGEDILES